MPLNSIVDNGLYNASKEVWGDRALVWGDNCYYVPNDETKVFLDMVYADDSPVVQVLSGHLHFKNDSALTNRANQHVFDASFNGTIGMITVTGKTE